jgi:hypothetical protein
MRKRGSAPLGEAGGTPAWRTRVLGLAFTIAAHGLVLTALFWPRAAPPAPPVRPTLAPLQVSLLPTPQPPAPDKVEAPTDFAQPALPRPPVLAMIAIAPDNSDLLSQSQLAGAAGAGEGGGGGGCDTAWRVQQALRRDPLVRGAVAGANRLGKASMLWNGDWVRSGGEDGKGLSAVREAVLWEVGFAPKPCRDERMHGLVLVSLADGRTRFAIGANDWRWSDLLGVRASNQ